MSYNDSSGGTSSICQTRKCNIDISVLQNWSVINAVSCYTNRDAKCTKCFDSQILQIIENVRKILLDDLQN